MRFRQKNRNGSGKICGLALVLSASLCAAAFAQGTAVVPVQIIYPGQTISASQVNQVDVTNPNLAGGYAKTKGDVIGMVSTRTLLPGRTIPLSGLREPHAIKRGANVRLTFAIGNMVISASGTPLADASVGDVIRVRNIDSGLIVSGTVMADGTVQVIAK